jgi:hypothetical protein
MSRVFLVLSLLLATCIVGLGAVDPTLLILLPADTESVTSINVENVRASDFGKFLLSRMTSNGQSLQKLIQETGFDPRRDLQSLLIVGSRSTEPTGASKYVVLARGIFDEDRIKAATSKNGSVAQNFEGVDILVRGQKPGSQNALAFLQSGVAAIGDLASLKEVITTRAHPSILDPKLQELISSAGNGNDVWFASIQPGFSGANKIPRELAGSMQNSQLLQSILESSGGLQFGNQMHLTLDLTMRSEKDASSVEDLLHFLGGMLQTQGQQDARVQLLAPAFDQMTLNTTGNSVHISTNLPEANLEQLAEMRPKPHVRPHQR